MPYADQVARLRELEAAHRRLEAELSLTVVALAESAGFKADGHSSVRALLRAELRWSEGEVTNRLRTGRLLADLPDVVDALGAGEVGVAQVHDLARARANPRCGSELAQHAGLLLGFARQLQYSDFHRCVRRWELLADADGAHRNAEAAHESRHASLRGRDGVGFLAGQGGALDTAELQEIWDAFAQAEFMNDVDEATAQVQGGTSSAAARAHSAGFGRRRRLFTGAAREAVMLYSPRCIWPGCATPAGRCDADHTHDWQHGGITAPANGAPICPRHDRWKNGGYRVRRDGAGIWHTCRADGSEIGVAAA